MGRKQKKSSGKPTAGALIEGTLIRSTGSWYKVRLASGQVIDCKLRGLFRTEGLISTNPVAVGDHLLISMEDDIGFIRDILPRRNYILRKAVNLAKRVHILCANVDQALILFTLDNPVTTLGYLDRLLVSAEAFGIQPIIIFNKIDEIREEERHARLLDFQNTYKAVGYKTISLSALDPSYKEQVVDLLRDKVSFVVGRSGAGKSSLINLAAPGLGLKTGSVSDFSGRGKHTTTFAEMFDLPFGGYIIDSPGFKEMDIYDIEKPELCHFFPEMQPFLDDCKFSNCLHTTEPGCAVKGAVEAGRIPASRYHTYLGMLEGVEENA